MHCIMVIELQENMVNIHKSPGEHCPSTYTSLIQYQHLPQNLQNHHELSLLDQHTETICSKKLNIYWTKLPIRSIAQETIKDSRQQKHEP